jgi:hypothetical protein
MRNQCEQCVAMMINGVYCHELGCPVREQELRDLAREDSEEFYEEE